jgi:hypothetical protein
VGLNSLKSLNLTNVYPNNNNNNKNNKSNKNNNKVKSKPLELRSRVKKFEQTIEIGYYFSIFNFSKFLALFVEENVHFWYSGERGARILPRGLWVVRGR